MTYENEFDVVLFKSVLGGVGHHGRKDRQRKALDAIYRALKPGGELLFAENLVASPLHRLMREQFTSWGDYWCYMTADELTSCMDSYANIDMKLVGFLGAFGRTETQRRMLGSLDIAFVERAVPRAWRYLAFGVARK
jgi:SAM-dependent methyltransferase